MYLVDFSITPLGKGESVSEYVARCVRIVKESGLDYSLHSMGTTIEGEWDEVIGVLRKCFEELQRDCSRITCSVKIDYRAGSEKRLQAKVQRVEQLIERWQREGAASRGS